ncbi:hypothetical protein SPRG_09904 [Saprolegnia parasitica CBS 223.65]|uniref:t-SNARE coiled-coil homology domain-containing protein n=1 Tax=Saprolegnia parasitica (strain CBS 223.65) TaxID=695850 RepID=A0A067C186_SAPPC|nr:hypothetical protein SPRG_09904 [Saprolegnia parasitica CBS 223.65]KDO24268.1 hypothetical protein SPRG_09904 [Saprolegnia parasitica CBS 223.65]|eukprot:XP_012205039.1 hypothetical protein SPRG_09904 [Saprolegnia parasitica CBS 223.65]
MSSREVDALLEKLAHINVEMGGQETRKDRAKAADRFGELRIKISDRLHGLKISLTEMAQPISAKKPQHPREKIKQQQGVRDDIRLVEEDLAEMAECYEAETKKKKSKFSPEELAIRKDFVDQYTSELAFIKEQASSAYVKASPGLRAPGGGLGFDRAALFGIPSATTTTEFAGFADRTASGSAGVHNASGGGPSYQEEEVTSEHRDIMLQIEQKDQHIDGMVEQIGTGVMELGVLARGLNEELQKQNMMLTGLEERIDNTQATVENLNLKMKKTLAQVGRSGDKCMMDFICLVILLGILAVAYNMFLKKDGTTPTAK